MIMGSFISLVSLLSLVSTFAETAINSETIVKGKDLDALKGEEAGKKVRREKLEVKKNIGCRAR
jgi:hypothetical protein